MTNTPNTGTATLETEGAELYYEVAGEGSWLVLAYAGIADRTMWNEQFAVFAQHYRVLRYDMRGFGDSPMAPGPFSHRQDLYDLLEQPCRLVGLTVSIFRAHRASLTASRLALIRV